MSWYIIICRKYNESLAKRGEILLECDIVKNWEPEQSKINEEMKTEIVATDSYIKFLRYVRIFFSFTVQTELEVNKSTFYI